MKNLPKSPALLPSLNPKQGYYCKDFFVVVQKFRTFLSGLKREFNNGQFWKGRGVRGGGPQSEKEEQNYNRELTVEVEGHWEFTSNLTSSGTRLSGT